MPAASDVYFDDRLYCETFLTIKAKSGKEVPLRLNRAQREFLRRRTGRDLIVKARQLGISTLVQARQFRKTVTAPGVTSVTIGGDPDNAFHLREITDLFWRRLPPDDRPIKGYHNLDRALTTYPGLESKAYIGTAGKRSFGRGDTIHNAHGSEVAFWPDAGALIGGLLEAVPEPHVNPDTDVALESTTNGAAGWFFDEVQAALRGESRFTLHFFPWWYDAQYRLALAPGEQIVFDADEQALVARHGLDAAQIKWRRAKMRDLGGLFLQEYPEDVHTAFLLSGRGRFDRVRLQERLLAQAREPVEVDLPVYEAGQAVYGWRIYELPEGDGEYVIGADTAEGLADGDFDAAVVRHRRYNRQVATLHGKWEPKEFAQHLRRLAVYYNGAEVGVERNNHGHTVLGYLANGTADNTVQAYDRLFAHNDGRPGWKTSETTRPVMLDDLAADYRGDYVMRDAALIGEALTFVINERGKAEAAPGANDDLVIADAIAGQMRQLGAQRQVHAGESPLSGWRG